MCRPSPVAVAFQPTRPLRGATKGLTGHKVVVVISTHAPLAGRDDKIILDTLTIAKFQPTRPLRGATAKEYKSLCTFLR